MSATTKQPQTAGIESMAIPDKATPAEATARFFTLSSKEHDFQVQVFEGEWDEEGVYVYQAFNHVIADWAVSHQRFGGPDFNPTRMTWIKPSFAWVLYRAGYGHKHNQERILKVKLPHAAIAELLSQCHCKHGGGGTDGRVQWDPARDLMSGEGREPRMMQRRRAIQIGLKGKLSEQYVASTISIQDVTELSHKVGAAHAIKDNTAQKEAMTALAPELPKERPYLPACSESALVELGMMPGERAAQMASLGRGKAPVKVGKRHHVKPEPESALPCAPDLDAPA